MQNEEIINTIKQSYSRDLRKQLVKSILQDEKNGDEEIRKTSYKLMNQIFSYVLSQLGWSIADHADKWDNTPLEIMAEVFPQLESTQWYQRQQLSIKESIEVKLSEEAKGN